MTTDPEVILNSGTPGGTEHYYKASGTKIQKKLFRDLGTERGTVGGVPGDYL